MKKVIMMFALAMGIATANAQENVTVGQSNGSDQPTLTKEVYPQKEADGDLYHGLTRKLGFDRMVPPHGLEVTYDKTVHVIFPAEVRYVDLGSPDLIAGKADGAENVIRVKATVRNFPNETNMSVITEDGSFYTFNVKYAAEPLLLNVEMWTTSHGKSWTRRWRSVPPCRSVSSCRSAHRTTPRSCRAKKASARSSRWRSSPSPTASASWWS